MDHTRRPVALVEAGSTASEMTGRGPPKYPGQRPHPQQHHHHHNRHGQGQDVKVYHNPIAQQRELDPPPEVLKLYQPPPDGFKRSKFRRFVYWVQDHPWLTALIILLLCLCLAIAILMIVCGIRGCSALGIRGSQESSSRRAQEPDPGIPRLLVAFKTNTTQAIDVVPQVLRPYVSKFLALNSSSLQLLEFVDAEALAAARTYLEDNPDLNFVIRDFIMGRFPNKDFNNTFLLQNVVSYVQSRFANDTATPSSTNTTSSTNSTSSGAGGANSTAGATAPRFGAGSENDPLLLDGSQWFMRTMGVQQAWQTTTGASEVVVAVLDTGADLAHPDLTPSLWINKGEIPGNGVDDDGNGFIDDVYGWDFAGGCTPPNSPPTSGGGGGGAWTGANADNQACTSSSTPCTARPMPWDAATHGTSVAGLVAAAAGNARGGAGVAPGVKLMILRVADCRQGAIFASAVVSAMDYAHKMGAHIIQASFGQNYPPGFYPMAPAPWFHASWIKTYATAMKPLEDRGMLVVAAAGNEGVDMDRLQSLGYAYSPCLVPSPNVLCVMATDPDDRASDFSNFGKATVHLAAPGRAIVSTMAGGTYGPQSGTSFSAPVVSGSAALVLSVLGAGNGNYYRGKQVKDILMRSATRFSGLPCNSSARINTQGAVMVAIQAALSDPMGGLVRVGPTYRSPTPTASVQQGSPAYSSVGEMPTTAAALAAQVAPAAVRGYTDYYYGLGGNQGMPASTRGLRLLDVSTRPGPSASFTSFKSATGLLSIQCFMQLTSAGIHSFQVATQAAAGSYRLLIENQVIALTDGIGSVDAEAPGLYRLELQLLAPRQRTDLMVRGPTATSFTVLNQCFSLASARYAPPSFGPARSPAASPESGLLGRGWLVHYNVSSPGSPGVPPGATTTLPPSLHASALAALYRSVDGAAANAAGGQAVTSLKYMYSTVLPDVNYPNAGGLRQALLPVGAAQPQGQPLFVQGVATTVLRASTAPRNLVFRLACRSCLLVLNDALVIDGHEADPAAAAAPRASGCITLPQGELVYLTLLFAAPDLAAATLAMGWAECNPGDGGLKAGDGAPFQALGGLVGTPDVWDPATRSAGYVSGVQCDVWRGASLPGRGSAGYALQSMDDTASADSASTAGSNSSAADAGFRMDGASWAAGGANTALPLYKLRLPGPLCNVTAGGTAGGTGSTTDTDEAACSRPWAFTLTSILPGMGPNSNGWTFSVRCWAYWQGGFLSPLGPRAMPANNPFKRSSVFVGGRQVWASTWPGAAGAANSANEPWANAAPLNSLLGPHYQLLAVEWLNVTAQDFLQLLDGNDNMQIDPMAFRLPIPSALVPPTGGRPTPYPPSASKLQPVGGVVVGQGGHLSVTSLPDVDDIGPLVYANLWGLRRMGVADLPAQGLDTLASYAPNIGRQVRYSAAHGFMLALSDVAEQYNLTVADSALSSSAVHVGGITLRNAPRFDPVTGRGVTTTARVYLLPGSYIPMAVITKTARPDGRTLFNIGVAAPSVASGPIDSSIWFRAAIASSGNTTSLGTATDDAGAGSSLGAAGRRRRAQQQRDRQAAIAGLMSHFGGGGGGGAVQAAVQAAVQSQGSGAGSDLRDPGAVQGSGSSQGLAVGQGVGLRGGQLEGMKGNGGRHWGAGTGGILMRLGVGSRRMAKEGKGGGGTGGGGGA